MYFLRFGDTYAKDGNIFTWLNVYVSFHRSAIFKQRQTFLFIFTITCYTRGKCKPRGATKLNDISLGKIGSGPLFLFICNNGTHSSL